MIKGSSFPLFGLWVLADQQMSARTINKRHYFSSGPICGSIINYYYVCIPWELLCFFNSIFNDGGLITRRDQYDEVPIFKSRDRLAIVDDLKGAMQVSSGRSLGHQE